MRLFLASGVRPGAPHRARHAGAALRSFITSIGALLLVALLIVLWLIFQMRMQETPLAVQEHGVTERRLVRLLQWAFFLFCLNVAGSAAVALGGILQQRGVGSYATQWANYVGFSGFAAVYVLVGVGGAFLAKRLLNIYQYAVEPTDDETVPE